MISGSGTTWSIEIENTGSEPIICFQFFLASGVLATTPGTGPAGWQLATNGQVIGGRSATGIPPGGKQTFTFPTSVPYPPNGGGRLNVSSNCQTDVAASVSGPALPPPKEKKCKCAGLTVTTRAANIGFASWSMTVDWTLTCTGDAGGGCQGEIRPGGWNRGDMVITRPKAPKAKKGETPKPLVLTCKGKCKKKPSKGSVRLSGRAEKSLKRTTRAAQQYQFVLNQYCDGKKVGNTRVTVVFDLNGRVDKKASDLNANGVPDGQDKKRR